MNYKGPFTPKHKGFSKFFEDQLPLCYKVSTVTEGGSAELPARMLCLALSVPSFDGARPLLRETPSPDSEPPMKAVGSAPGQLGMHNNKDLLA